LWAVSWSRAAVHAGQKNSAYGDRQGVLHARVIATGIPGAGAVSEVGDFLRGSPMYDNALFTPYAQPGKVLDPKRVLVASTSNFGAPLARGSEPEGSILSIDPGADQVTVPAGFAATGDQASALDGAVSQSAKLQIVNSSALAWFDPYFLNVASTPNVK
jgi:hypothetical protein